MDAERQAHGMAEGAGDRGRGSWVQLVGGKHARARSADLLAGLQQRPADLNYRQRLLQEQPEVPTTAARLHQAGKSLVGEGRAQQEQLGDGIGQIHIETEPAAPAAGITRGEGQREVAGEVSGEQCIRDRALDPAIGAVSPLEGVGLAAIDPQPLPGLQQVGVDGADRGHRVASSRAVSRLAL